MPTVQTLEILKEPGMKSPLIAKLCVALMSIGLLAAPALADGDLK